MKLKPAIEGKTSSKKVSGHDSALIWLHMKVSESTLVTTTGFGLKRILDHSSVNFRHDFQNSSMKLLDPRVLYDLCLQGILDCHSGDTWLMVLRLNDGNSILKTTLWVK